MGHGSEVVRRCDIGTFSTELSLDGTFRDRWFRGAGVRIPADLSRSDGPLTTRRVHNTAGELEVIDTTTWSLAARGRVPVRFTPSNGPAVDATIRCPPRSPGAAQPLPATFFPGNEIEQFVAVGPFPETGLRAPIVASRTTFREYVWEVRNRARKIVAYVQTIDIAPTSSRGTNARFVRVLPLRGYRREAERIVRRAVEVPAYLPVDEALAACGRRRFDYSTKVRLSIDGDTPLGETHRRVIRFLDDTVRLNVPGVAHMVDTEFLHDLRVALRRMRTYLAHAGDALPPETVARARETVRRLARATGPARELDVLLLSQQRYTAMVEPVFAPAVDEFFRHIAERRKAAYETVRGEIDRYLSDDALETLIGAASLVGGATRDTARRAVEKRRRSFRRGWRALVEEYHRRGDRIADEALHRLRIRGKRYRYVQELLGDVSGVRANESVKKLKYFQDRLGRFNDLCVEQSRLTGRIADGDHASPRVAAALGALVEAISREKRAGREAIFEYLRRKTL